MKRKKCCRLILNKNLANPCLNVTVQPPLRHFAWGGENRSISDDFGDETDSTFVPCILLFSSKGALHISPGQRPGSEFVFLSKP
jgi:hypothetical protein